MRTTKVSTKGQVVIPAELRDLLGWRAGTELQVERRGGTLVLRAAVALPVTTIDDLRTCVHYEGPALSVEEMDDAVARMIRDGDPV